MVYQTFTCSCGRCMAAGRTQADIDKQCRRCKQRFKEKKAAAAAAIAARNLDMQYTCQCGAWKGTALSQADADRSCTHCTSSLVAAANTSGTTNCPSDHFNGSADESRQAIMTDMVEAARLLKTEPETAELQLIRLVNELDHLTPVDKTNAYKESMGVFYWLFEPLFLMIDALMKPFKPTQL